MFASEDFTYDGQKASSFGLKLVRMDASFFIMDPIAGAATLTETELPNDFRSHLYKIKRNALEFKIQLSLVDKNYSPVEWTLQRKQTIFNWIFKNDYKELIFSDEPEVCYYALISSGLDFYSNYEKGYLELIVKTNSPYPWITPQKVLITGNSSSPIVANKLSLVGKPKPVFEKIYLKTTLSRIAGTETAPYFSVSTQPLLEMITLNQAKISKASLINPSTSVDRIYFDGERKIVWEVDSDGNLIQSLYKYRDTTRGDKFPYITYSHPGTIQLAAGWNAEIEYQYPILR